jgi:hypothetical protein
MIGDPFHITYNKQGDLASAQSARRATLDARG